MHRRNVLGLLAGATVVVIVPALARAQTSPAETWAVFTQEGLGFTVEFPAAPKISDDTEDGMRHITLDVDFGDMLMGASRTDRPADEPPERTAEFWMDQVQNHTLKVMGLPILSERRFVQQGFPAGEYSFGKDDYFGLARLVVTPKAFFSLNFVGPKPLADNPDVQRVLNSFTLTQ